MGIFVSKFLNAAQHFSLVKFITRSNFGAGAATTFFPVVGEPFNSTENNVQAAAPYAFTATGLLIDVNTNTLDPTSVVTFTLRKNGVDTLVAKSFTPADPPGRYVLSGFSESIAQADLLAWGCTKTGPGGSFDFHAIEIIGKVPIA